MGRLQATTIYERPVVAWLEWLCVGLPQGARLFPGSGPVYCALIREVLAELGLGGLGLTPAGLRAGGAPLRFHS
eukprot:1942187-Heterocapsa_arctica.AAC.1